MKELQEMVGLLTGEFDNKAQFEAKEQAGEAFPYARHVNTVCNDKITNLPADFAGLFVVEESYYTQNGSTHAAPHLFLFTQEGEKVKLTSYDLPQGYDKNSFTYQQMGQVEFGQLKVSEKFTPAVYEKQDGVWEGGSVSMFTPVLKFTLFERFSPQVLEVTEHMEVGGKRTFGYDEPILYKRLRLEL